MLGITWLSIDWFVYWIFSCTYEQGWSRIKFVTHHDVWPDLNNKCLWETGCLVVDVGGMADRDTDRPIPTLQVIFHFIFFGKLLVQSKWILEPMNREMLNKRFFVLWYFAYIVTWIAPMWILYERFCHVFIYDPISLCICYFLIVHKCLYPIKWRYTGSPCILIVLTFSLLTS